MENIIEQVTKKCPMCGNFYPSTTEFFRKHKIYRKDYSKVGLYSYCKNCERIIKKRERIKYWESNLIHGIGHCRLKKKHFTITKSITKEDIKQIYQKQNGLCYWLKIPLDITFKDKLRQPSIDRLDNSKGYDLENIILTSQFANLGRQSSTKEDFLKFINNYINK